MDATFKKSFVVAVIVILLDFLFHYFLTHPMETLTYFVIKFFLAFFVASALFGSSVYKNRTNGRGIIIFMSGLIFSLMMSTYYRAWELGEVGVPFGSRAPDIINVARTNLILFSGTWWLGHALFFVAGVWLANRMTQAKG